MRKISYSLLWIVIATIFFANISAWATSLAWEASSSGGIPDGYKILIGTTSGSYTVGELDVGNVTEYDIGSLYSALGLSSGIVYYFTVMAYNNDGNSTCTQEVSYGLNVAMERILTDDGATATLTDLDSEGNIVKETNISHTNVWYPLCVSLASNGEGALLWDNFQGTVVIWFLDSNGNKTGTQSINYTAGTWYPRSYSLNSDGTAELMWDNLQGTIVIWFLDSSGNHISSQQYNYTSSTWFLTSYSSNIRGGLFVWDNIVQNPIADTWLWLDDDFVGNNNNMDKYKLTHHTDVWTPISAGIMGPDDTLDQGIAWLDETGKRVIIHWLHKGVKTGKYLDISQNKKIIWVDTR